MISRLIVILDYKEFVTILGSFIIVKMTWQYTICGDNDISDYKLLWFFHNDIKFLSVSFP